MKRYIFDIQYNKGDKNLDKVWIDAIGQKQAMRKLSKLYPGVYSMTMDRIAREVWYI